MIHNGKRTLIMTYGAVEYLEVAQIAHLEPWLQNKAGFLL